MEQALESDLSCKDNVKVEEICLFCNLAEIFRKYQKSHSVENVI